MLQDTTANGAPGGPKTPKRVTGDRPAKPYPTFPQLISQWAKKIRDRFVVFGTWAGPMGARERYLDWKDQLHAGLLPRRRGTTSPEAPAFGCGTASTAPAR